MSNNYVIGCGYFARQNRGAEWFFDLWLQNTLKYCQPKKIFVVAAGGQKLDGKPVDWITVDGDLGGCGDILNHAKPYPYCGNGPAVCVSALLAYLNESDYVYKEQDALCFGPWVEKMYEEIGDGGFIMGKDNPLMPCANSVFLIKHSFIPAFVSWYMSSEPEDKPDTIGEHKFARWRDANRKQVRDFSFGYDRMRPLNISDPVFYAQKLTADELKGLKEAGLIEFESLPEGIGKFTNYD